MYLIKQEGKVVMKETKTENDPLAKMRNKTVQAPSQCNKMSNKKKPDDGERKPR